MSLDEALVNFVLLLIMTASFSPAILVQIRLADGISALITSVLVNDITAELIAVGTYAYETSDGYDLLTEWTSRLFTLEKKKEKKKHSTHCHNFVAEMRWGSSCNSLAFSKNIEETKHLWTDKNRTTKLIHNNNNKQMNRKKHMA